MANLFSQALQSWRGSPSKSETSVARVANQGEVSVYAALQNQELAQRRSSAVSGSSTVGLSDAAAWFSYFGLDASALTVTPQTALGLTAFQACLDVTTSALAQVPLGVYEEAEQGKRYASDHSLHKLIKVRPNRHMSSFMFRKTLFVHVYMYGHGVAEIIRDQRNRPESFVILQPGDYSILESSDGVLFIQKKDGKLLQEEDFIHLKGISLDGKYAKGLPFLHKRVIKMGFGAQEFLNQYYEKGTHLQGYLKSSKDLKQGNANAIGDAWDEAYSTGLGGFGKTPVLGSDTDYKPITRTPVESQLTEFLSLHPVEIYRMFRVPPHLVADTTKATSFGKGIEDMSIMYVTFTLIPLATQFEQELDWKAFRTSEVGRFYTKHNFNGLMRGDFAGRMEGFTKGIQAGIFSPNDARSLEDMNGYEGGDTYMVNGNMISVKQVGKEPAATPNGNEEGNPGNSK